MTGAARHSVILQTTLLILSVLAAGATARSQEAARPGADTPEPTVLSLRECVQLALKQNPDVLLARLDQQVAQARIGQVADARSLKLGVGSGLAYSSGFPMNVGGSGPSLVNAQASFTLYDRPLQYRIAEAKERAKTSGLTEREKQSAIALDVTRLFLDAEALSLAKDTLASEIASLERIADIRNSRLGEGKALPLDVKRARASIASARYRLREVETSLARAQDQLGFLLGLDPGASVAPARGERLAPETPESLSTAKEMALSDSPELDRLSSELAANQLRQKAASSTHWPVVRLVAQYSMFSRFNNYDDFYNRFERHNGQIGASFELPLFTGSAARSEITEASVESQRLRLNVQTARGRIAMETADAFRQAQDAEEYHQVVALDLELARENVSVVLARANEGKASLEELEAARTEESRKWTEYYRSRASAELAAYEILHKTGRLIALFR